MYTSCTQTVFIWEIVSAGLGLPLQQIGHRVRRMLLHVGYDMAVQVERDTNL